MWDSVVVVGNRGRFTINEAFPLSSVIGEQELLNVFQTLAMHVLVQALKDRVGAICKNMRPCVEVGAFGLPLGGGGIVSRTGKGFFWANEVLATFTHVLRIRESKLLDDVKNWDGVGAPQGFGQTNPYTSSLLNA